MKEELIDEMSNLVDTMLEEHLQSATNYVARMNKRGLSEEDTLEILLSGTRVFLLHMLSNHMKLTAIPHLCATSAINDTHIEVNLTLIEEPQNKEVH